MSENEFKTMPDESFQKEANVR